MPKIKIDKKRLGIIILSLSLFAGVIAVFVAINFKNLQSLGYLGVFLANLIGSATIIFPVPSFATTIAVGAFSSPLLTALFSSLGSTLGELTGYFAGKGGNVIAEKEETIKKVEKWMDKHGLWVIFALAAIPNPFFDVAGIISGMSGIPIKKYLLTVFFGKLIKFTILAYTGFGFLKLIQI